MNRKAKMPVADATSAAGAQVRICLLGSPRILVGNATVTGSIKYRKGIALLSLLAMEDRVMHPRERIANLFWPDLSRTAALTNLRQVLSNLIQVLSPVPGQKSTVIRGDSSQIGFFPGPEHQLEVDVHMLREYSARTQAGEASPGDGWQPPLHRLMEGFELPDCPDYSAWLENERIQIDEDIVGLHEAAAARAIEEDNIEVALLHARLIERLNPLHEANQVLIMRLHLQSGRPKLALRQYEHFAERLREELDVEPEPATTALHKHILQRLLSGEAMTIRPQWHFQHKTNTTAVYITCDAAPGRSSSRDQSMRLDHERLHALLTRHSQTVVVSHGLGLFAYFDRAHQGEHWRLAAIEAARAVLAGMNCPERVRVGIYSGLLPEDAHTDPGPSRRELTELSRRLGFVANGGDIIVCSDTLGNLSIELEYLGEWRFRGINRLVHAYRIDPPDRVHHSFISK